MKMWNMFSGKLSGGTESMYVPNVALCLLLPSSVCTYPMWHCACYYPVLYVHTQCGTVLAITQFCMYVPNAALCLLLPSSVCTYPMRHCACYYPVLYVRTQCGTVLAITQFCMYVPNAALCLLLPSSVCTYPMRHCACYYPVLSVTFRCGCFAKGDFSIGGNESAVIYGICGHALSEGKVPCHSSICQC